MDETDADKIEVIHLLFSTVFDLFIVVLLLF
jgi:hypothetical protein